MLPDICILATKTNCTLTGSFCPFNCANQTFKVQMLTLYLEFHKENQSSSGTCRNTFIMYAWMSTSSNPAGEKLGEKSFNLQLHARERVGPNSVSNLVDRLLVHELAFFCPLH